MGPFLGGLVILFILIFIFQWNYVGTRSYGNGCVRVEHLKRCETSVACGGHRGPRGVGGQQDTSRVPCKRTRAVVLGATPYKWGAAAGHCRGSPWAPLCADATERITDSPWAVTPSVGTAAGMSIILLVLFLPPFFFSPLSVSFPPVLFNQAVALSFHVFKAKTQLL